MWRSVEYGHRGFRGWETSFPVQIRAGSVLRHGDKHNAAGQALGPKSAKAHGFLEVREGFEKESELEPGLKKC